MGDSVSGSGHDLCKGPGVGACLACLRSSREARVAGAEGWSDRMGGAGDRGHRALWTIGQIWAFVMKEMGAIAVLSRGRTWPASGAHRSLLASMGHNSTNPRA